MFSKHIAAAISLLGAFALAGCSTDAAAPPPSHPSSQAAAIEAVPDVPAAEAPPVQKDDAPPPAPPPPPGPDHGSIVGSVSVTPSNMGKHVIVYLKDGPHDDGKIANVSIDQKGMAFIPFVTSIPTGSKVTFLNEDPFPHNVFSPDGEKFDLGTAAQGHAKARLFTKPGVYTILCNLHPNMLAYVVVSPSTFVTKADKDGKFVLAGVPNGTYTVAAWAPRLPEQTVSVTVAGADVPVDIKLHR